MRISDWSSDVCSSDLLRELARIFAVGIITASDERPEAPTAQREPFGSAIGAEPGIAAVALVGEEIEAEEFVEPGGNLRRLLFHHLAGARLEIAPEAVEHRLPLRAAARHVVEFPLEPGGAV